MGYFHLFVARRRTFYNETWQCETQWYGAARLEGIAQAIATALIKIQKAIPALSL